MLEALNTTSVTNFANSYLQSLPSLINQGDVGAIVVGLTLAYILLILTNKLSYYLVKIMKYVVVVAIVLSAFYAVVMTFIAKMAGAEPLYMVIGLIGMAIGFVGVLIAMFSLYNQAVKAARVTQVRENKMVAYQSQLIEEEKRSLAVEKKHLEEERAKIKGATAQLQETVAEQGAILTTLTYIVIAEFGVFSSGALGAPTVEIGLIVFALFSIGVVAYTLKTFTDRKDGLKTLGTAFAFAFVLSIVLGHFWAGHPLGELLSTAYFTMDSLVAFISGIGLSIFLGGKGL